MEEDRPLLLKKFKEDLQRVIIASDLPFRVLPGEPVYTRGGIMPELYEINTTLTVACTDCEMNLRIDGMLSRIVGELRGGQPTNRGLNCIIPTKCYIELRSDRRILNIRYYLCNVA